MKSGQVKTKTASLLRKTAAIGVIIFCASIFFSKEPLSKSTPVGQNRLPELTRQAREMVNKNLQADQSLLHLRAQKVKAENFEARSKKIQFDSQSLEQTNIELIDPSVHDGSHTLYEDIHGDQSVYNTELSPAEKIEAKLDKMRTLEEYDYQQKLAYIEAYVENAWEQGYQVKINEELEVVSVKRVNTKGPYRGRASLSQVLQQGYQ